MLALPATAGAHEAESTQTATVRHRVGDSAPEIGLIGDSTLSGVRWFDEFGALERFNFVFDAESCRRTIERSCWSREQYRPRNALTALQEESGGWGDVLVVMTGYNDSADGFVDGVEAIVDEARRQEVGTVVWLSLRTKGVDYEEPLHLANGSTYREANRQLYELADELDGYLQVADWATYSADFPEWFEPDGAHLAPEGAVALTEFIAEQVDVVLAGGSVTPDPVPWEEVREGDEGELVVDVQQALIDAVGDDQVVADGVFGPQTAAAVTDFQREAGLGETGAVDAATAAALDLYELPTTTTTVAPTTTTVAPAVTTTVARPEVAGGARGGVGADGLWWLLLLAVPGAVWLVRRTRTASRPAGTFGDRAASGVIDDDETAGRALDGPMLYDHVAETESSS